jgi:D-aminopeptidase
MLGQDAVLITDEHGKIEEILIIKMPEKIFKNWKAYYRPASSIATAILSLAI